MENSEYGILRIKAYLAEGSIPLQGAKVTVRPSNVREKDHHTRFTDQDGFTSSINLPAPPKALSQTPTPESIPYAIYDITVSKDGYYTERILSVPIFSGIDAIVPVNMIPTRKDGNGNPPQSNLTLNANQNYKAKGE